MLMRARNVKLYHVAELLRVSDSLVCEKLQGRSKFAPHEKTRLAWFFGVKEEWLFAQEEIPASARLQPAPFAPGWAR
jgi:plasmid maintenance system antidote protein VapI